MAAFKNYFLISITVVQVTHGWDSVFNFAQCYEKRMDERMPLSIDNLIALVEKYEKDNYNTSPEDMASAILLRYRKNGVVFKPGSSLQWSTHQDFEAYKQDVDDSLLKPNIIVPENTYVPREECSLHMSVSHAIDLYPFSGVDFTWENQNNFFKRKKRFTDMSSGSNSRSSSSTDRSSSNSRQYSSSNSRQSYSNSGSNSRSNSGSSSRSNSGSSLSSSSGLGYSSSSSSRSFYDTDMGTHEYADHPLEYGVIQTQTGPIAGGLLLAGIMSIGSSASYTVQELVGKDQSDYMPNEMKQKRIGRLYGSTLSGELAEAAVLQGRMNENSNFQIGPIGMFGNYSSCARDFSLKQVEYTFLSRAEIFAAVDAIIIAKTMEQYSSSSSVKMSQILRMYYSNHGLYKQQIKACNRHRIFNQLKDKVMDDIEETALNYMYVYQNYFPEVKNFVGYHQDDFNMIETDFSKYLSVVVKDFENFMSTYNFDDPGAEDCPVIGDRDFNVESLTDLVVVYTPIGSSEEARKQAEYIAQTSRKIGVGYHRSRVAVFNGRSMNWLTPMTNFSNVADYACNYTTFLQYSTTSTQDFLEVMDELTKYYYYFYKYLRSDPDRTGTHSQVVMWNLPNSFKNDREEMLKSWEAFNSTYPDVDFIFVGNRFSTIQEIFQTPEEDIEQVTFVSNNQADPDKIAEEITAVIKEVPRMFIYPACDINNETYTNYRESNHIYKAYVSSNFTVLLRIPPENFKYSEYVKLSFKSSDVIVCISRTEKMPSTYDSEQETYCKDAKSSFDYEMWYLCDRYVEDCDPIYISFTGNAGKNQYCSDVMCQFPNQIEFEMTHEGMICGALALFPTPILLISLLLFGLQQKFGILG